MLHARLALPIVLGAIACFSPAAQRQPAAGNGWMIDAERIAASGATDAWDALVRTHAPLGMNESPNGEPAGLTRRGRNSLMLSSTPMLVVDEVVMSDFLYLRRIPAQTIEFIRVLNGPDGTVRYGTGAGNGVVVVQTRAR